MAEALGMAKLVRGEQRLAQQHHVALPGRHRRHRVFAQQAGIGDGDAAAIGGQAAAIGVPVVADGADAVGVHPHLGSDDLSGARIAIGAAAGKAALVAV